MKQIAKSIERFKNEKYLPAIICLSGSVVKNTNGQPNFAPTKYDGWNLETVKV